MQSNVEKTQPNVTKSKGGERTLEKTSWVSGNAAMKNPNLNQSLTDMDKDGTFDQFKGKNTDYDFDLYSTKIDHNQVSEEVK